MAALRSSAAVMVRWAGWAGRGGLAGASVGGHGGVADGCDFLHGVTSHDVVKEIERSLSSVKRRSAGRVEMVLVKPGKAVKRIVMVWDRRGLAWPWDVSSSAMSREKVG